MLTLRVERLLTTDAALAADTMWDMVALARSWKPIEGTSVVYDDGRHQEGLMSVSRDGRVEHLRIVRFRRGLDIEFFNPVPPPMMEVHRGAWRFEAINPVSCRVVAEREYRLIRGPQEAEERYVERTSAFQEALALRLGAMLESFGAWLQARSGGAAPLGGTDGNT